MANKVFGHGIQIQRGDTTTEGETNFTLIPGFRGAPGIGGTSDIKDLTDHDTTGILRSKGSGLADFDTIDGTLFFDPDDATHIAVLDDWVNGTVRDYKIVLPPGVVKGYGFRGQVSKFKQSYPHDDYVTCDVSFSIRTFDFDFS